MCGIFGIVCGQNSSLAQKEAITLLPVMFELAEKRGREASGLAIASENQVHVHKSAGSARTMLRSAAYQRFIGKTTGESGNEKHSKIAVIGHSRLVTNGGKGFAENNQPVIVDSCVGVHNGIIVNYSEIMKKYHIDSGNSDLDSRIIFELIGQYLEGGLDVAEAVTATFKELEGEANIALFATTAAAHRHHRRGGPHAGA